MEGARNKRNQLKQLLERDDLQGALAWVERRWPRPADGLDLSRLGELLRSWPARAAQELEEASAEDRGRRDVAEKIASALFMLDDAGLERLIAVDAPYRAELVAAACAHRLVAEGRDGEAMEALRAIGLRSPFRGARLFLRGLMAFYRHEDEDAAKAFSRLSQSDAQWRLSQTLLMVLEPNGHDGGSAPKRRWDIEELLDRRVMLRPFGLERCGDQLLLDAVGRLVREGAVNRALRAAAKIRTALGSESPVIATLQRSLPGALLAAGLAWDQVLIRLDRAIPPQDELERDQRIALVAEADGEVGEAIDAWTRYLSTSSRGADGIVDGKQVEVIAALSCRVGQLFTRVAESEDREWAEQRPFFRRRRGRSEFWEPAYHAFEQALNADPEMIAAWQGQLEAARCLSDKRERARVLERFITALPEHPEALRAAAVAAGDRKAFDKGLRFLRRAVELEPLNRELRDIEVRLLCGKARKKHKAGAVRDARKLYREVRRLTPRCTSAVRSRSLAEATSYARMYEFGEELQNAELQGLAEVKSPWVWIALLYIETERHREAIPPERVRRGRVRALPPPRSVPPPPDDDPSPDEVDEVSKLCLEYEETQGDLSRELFELLQSAFEKAGPTLKEKDQISRAISMSRTLDLRLRLAERGHELFPDETEFIGVMYSTALELLRPASYFADSVLVLDRARKSIRNRAERHLEGLPPELSEEMYEHVYAVLKNLAHLAERIDTYCALERITPRRRRRGRRRRSSRPQRGPHQQHLPLHEDED